MCCSTFSNQTPVRVLWHAQRPGSLRTQQKLVHSLVTLHTIGATFYDLSAVTAQHGRSIAQRQHAMEQLILCDRHNSITAAYFDAPFAQGESQGAEKWQRLSFSLLRVVFETAEACKVSLGRAEANFFISCDYFSCVRKTFCAQGRHTA